MKIVLCVALLCVVVHNSAAVQERPKVQVYSRNPGEFDKDNTLICHVSGFHPPDIKIDLLKDGHPITDFKQSDLAFEQGWRFHLTKTAPFTPKKGDEYSCRVTHSTIPEGQTFSWEPDM
ncbi:beta-2-microglobulin-like [Amia ocellicauda]|uniref:beta-2-microglobulin-like n=1 Tax=Amia ocellicauda TaxID=2972642 RepID=UPI003464B21E